MSIKTLLLAGLTVGALGTAAAADPYTYAPNDPYSYEPAPGTYQNGYVWVAGAYEWIDGAQVFVPAHWQLAEPAPQPTVVVRGGWQVPRFEHRFERRFDRDHDRDDRRFDRDRGDRRDRGFERGGRTARSYRRGSRY